MAIVNGYTTLALVKGQMNLPTTDTHNDADLERIIQAVSRMIDNECERRFYVASETRYYTARRADMVRIDDLVSITSLKTDDDGDRVYETTWAATDYDLEPVNGPLESQPEPYTRIHVAPNGRYWFPYDRRGVQVVGSFGYAATVPDVVQEACMQQVITTLRGMLSGSNTVGTGDFQQVINAGLHPFVKHTLSPVSRKEYR